MTFKNFSTPHCHQASLDTASTPAAFAKREVELGTGTLTVTDHGTLAGCQAVYELAKKKKLIPVLGLEGYFRDDDCPVLGAAGIEKRHPKKSKSKEDDTSKPKGYSQYSKYHHFTTHFLDQAAFQTGIRLLSRAPTEQHGSEIKPLFDWRAMEELGAANVTLTTGCLIGMVQRHLLDHGNAEMAEKYYQKMRAMARPGHFFVEVFPHVCSHNWVEGVFLTLKEGEGEPFTLRFYAGKNLRTNAGEVKAGELAKEFARKDNRHELLVGVKDYHTWTERPPATIVAVKHVEDFIQNECRPYAPEGDVQLGGNQFMLEMAKKYGDPVLISDDSHYAHPDEKIVQDVRLAQSGSWRFYGSYHRQSSDEAWQYFSAKMGVDEKTFEGWVANSHEWATRFRDFKLTAKPDLPVKFFEEKYASVGAHNSLEYILHLVKKHGRYVDKPEYKARLNAEIKLLYKNGVIDLLPYFMIDEEVCSLYTERKMITGPGRGSAAGLLLTYYLGITHVDPLRYGLSLDRFLTLDRIRSGKLPDIDQDLPTREPLVGEDGNSGWLKERFGDHVAQISTVMTLKLRSAVLDVARFKLGVVPKDIADLAHRFEMPPQGLEDYKFVNGYEDSGNWVPGSVTFDPYLQQYVKLYPDHWEIVQKCLGLGRSTSRHACAYVIANRPIWEFIPLTMISDVVCTQFTAPAVEAMGGLKMDFLVINSLNDIANCIKMVQERFGMPIPDGTTIDGKWVPSTRLLPKPKFRDGMKALFEPGVEPLFVDVWDLPEDQAVFADVACGRTETVFQFNTPGAVQWLRHFGYKKPNGQYAINSIESMSAFTALDRPGPLDAKVSDPDSEDGGHHNMLVEYARRARNAKPSPDIFPIFDRLFPETHGIMVYQEQLQRLYQEVTGCSGPDAEEFRSNVAKKKKEKVIEAYPKFMEGATVKLGSKESAEVVWQFINTWAAYGFNKSHSVCYSVIGYACAYLKHHYPLEWWTAVLKNAKKEEINDKFWKHCGHLIDLPDVTKSHENFEIVGARIQAPLSLLHGIGAVAHQELIASAPYKSIVDFVDRREQRKIDTTTTQMVDEMEEYVDDKGEKAKRPTGNKVEKVVKGRSSLHAGVVYRLIVSGAMDKLFDQGTDTIEMMEAYEKAVFDYKQRGKKKPSQRKSPEPVPPQYRNLNIFTRYQLRKQILPAYSEPILESLLEVKEADVKIGKKGKPCLMHGENELLFARARDIERINSAPLLPQGGATAAIAVYVTDVRLFEYGEKDAKTGVRPDPKHACEINVDLDGTRLKFVKWPSRETGRLDPRFNATLKDSIAILIINKYKEKKPFSVEDVRIVQPAPAEDKPQKEESP